MLHFGLIGVFIWQQDMQCSQITALGGAGRQLWSWYELAANPQARLEARTSRRPRWAGRSTRGAGFSTE